MAELTATQARSSAQMSFFFWMAAAMTCVIYGGFGISYWAPMATGSLRPVAPVVHFHGLFYFLWMVLLVAQPTLIARGNVALHRSMGMVGVMLGTGLVIFGSIVTVLNVKALMVTPEGLPEFWYPLMWLSVFALVNFGILFTLAIKNVRDSAAHKRYMMLATVAFIGAGINRFISFVLNIGPTEFSPFWLIYLATDVFIVALVAYDFRTLGKPHRATLGGSGLIILTQVLHPIVVHTAWWIDATHWMGNLAV